MSDDSSLQYELKNIHPIENYPWANLGYAMMNGMAMWFNNQLLLRLFWSWILKNLRFKVVYLFVYYYKFWIVL